MPGNDTIAMHHARIGGDTFLMNANYLKYRRRAVKNTLRGNCCTHKLATQASITSDTRVANILRDIFRLADSVAAKCTMISRDLFYSRS